MLVAVIAFDPILNYQVHDRRGLLHQVWLLVVWINGSLCSDRFPGGLPRGYRVTYHLGSCHCCWVLWSSRGRGDDSRQERELSNLRRPPKVWMATRSPHACGFASFLPLVFRLYSSFVMYSTFNCIVCFCILACASVVLGISPMWSDAFVAPRVSCGVVLRVGGLRLLRACARLAVDPCPFFARLKWGGWGLGVYPLAGCGWGSVAPAPVPVGCCCSSAFGACRNLRPAAAAEAHCIVSAPVPGRMPRGVFSDFDLQRQL